MLRSAESIHRFLLSSPAYFVGEAEEDDQYLLTPVFPGAENGQNKHGGSFFSLTFNIPFEKPATNFVVMPNYSHMAKDLSAVLCAFYGKLVSYEGPTERNGVSYINPFRDPSFESSPRFPFNDEPRAATQVALNLSLAKPIIQGLYCCEEMTDELVSLIRASTFYQAALKQINEEPVLAFTLLLSSIEALIPIYQFVDEELIDDDLRKILDAIEKHVPTPAKMLKMVRKRLFQIRRKCSVIVEKLLDADFFENVECTDSFLAISPDSLVRRIKAAYDLRSMFLHTGKTQGVWVDAFQFQRGEIVIGEPVIENDEKLKKLVMESPTLTGLERVVQYCLCGLIHDLVIDR